MATAATSLLGLALPVTGELSGTWGDTVNVSITALLDTAVAGTTTLSSDADVTLTTTTLAANQARQAIILWTAGGTVTRTITVPAQSKSYIVINKTSGSQSIKIVGAGPTTGVTIVAGTAAFVVWNGVDFVTASVTSTTGVLPVANGGTGLTSGTSGGVLAYTAAGTLASSAALAASALVIGGGAGAAPSTTTTGTGVVTALGVNTGTAGAFVVNGGALGTPSSGTVTNLTGTASININGTVGATTATTGAFTTGTFSGNVGIAVTPSAWGASWKAFQMRDGASLSTINAINTVLLSENAYQDETNWRRIAAGYASQYQQYQDTHTFAHAVSSTANSIISWVTDATISSTGLAVTGALTTTDNITLTKATGVPKVVVTATTGTNEAYFQAVNTGGSYYFGAENSAGSWFGATAYALAISAPAGKVVDTLIAGSKITTVSSTGLAVTGTLSATGTLSGGTSGTGYSFSGSAPATSLTLDSAGNLGLGVTPSAWNAGGKIIELGFAGNILYGVSYSATGATNNAYYNTGWKFANPSSARASLYEQSAGTHAWNISTAAGTAGNAITFTQAMTLDASGNLLVGTTSFPTGITAGGVYKTTVADYIYSFWNANASPYGIFIKYDTDANNTGNEFLSAYGLNAQRISIRSNGGIANYSANNVNLSDRREKTNFAPAGSYLDKICAIPVQTFNYIDQNLEQDGGLTLGVVAQDVQAVAPELVMESNWATKDKPEKMRLSIYQTDLQYALMKCIQEQQALITQLTARITALETA